MPITMLLLLLSDLGTASSMRNPASGIRPSSEGLALRTSIIAYASMAILFVAAVRCWLFVRLAKQETPELMSSHASHPDLASMSPH